MPTESQSHGVAHVTQRSLFVFLAMSVAVAALGFAALRSGDVILYNHSRSLPLGFYLRTELAPALGAIVTIRARDAAPAAASQRRFNGDHDRFIKRIAARGGDLVCAQGGVVTINGVRAAEQRASASDGGPLEAWHGCRTLGADEYFLLGDTPDSFDSRYWGPITAAQIEGVWRKL